MSTRGVMLMQTYDENYLLNKRVKIYQPFEGYRASTDAVWVAAAVSRVKKGDNILDAGTGTGAIALCLAQRFKDCGISITGIEKQPLLAQAAALSAKANGFDFVQIINADIFHAGLKPCSFAHVITNPPYAEDDMPSPNNSKAMAHNFQDGGLKEWLDFCIKMLRPQGHFYIINRAEALENIIACLHGRLGKIEVLPLCSKPGQPAKRVIIRAQKDSKAPLVLHPAILIHQPDGSHSAAAEAVLRDGLSI